MQKLKVWGAAQGQGPRLIRLLPKVPTTCLNFSLVKRSEQNPSIQTHYSKSQIFVQHFHEFSPKILLAIFFVKSNLSAAKKSKTTTFSRIFSLKFLTIFLVKSKLPTAKKSKITTFSPKKFDNFLGKSKLNFRTKMKISNSVEMQAEEDAFLIFFRHILYWLNQ